MHKKLTLIVNPIAGGGKHQRDIIEFISEYFCQRDHEIAVKETTGRGEATEFAQQAVDNNADIVVAVGGDGTINEVGSGLVNTNVTMGIIPCGSGNGLARSLNIPQNLEQACQLILEGKICSIDVGKANERYFFLVAGVGFDAKVGKRFDDYPNRGPISYFYVGAKEFFVYKPEWVKISLNGKTFEISPFVVAVANGRQYGNGAIIAPDAKLNDGLLDISIVHQLSFFQVFGALRKLFNGEIKDFPDAEFHKSQTVLIERQRPALVNIDGEPIWEGPVVECCVLPKALRVFAAQDSPCLS
ncbi:MAG: diacylglycerol/lipid kinase family protein [bacterium]